MKHGLILSALRNIVGLTSPGKKATNRCWHFCRKSPTSETGHCSHCEDPFWAMPMR